MPRQTTTIGLIRHSITAWNAAKKLQGQQDSPLTELGVRLAGNWGEMLKDHGWDRLLVSDLGRAQQTATLMNKTLHIPVTLEPRLREQDWGQWTGKTLAEIKQRDEKRLNTEIDKGWLFRPPGGESRFEVLERTVSALSNAVDCWAGEHILVVCHEGVIKCLLYDLAGRAFLPAEEQLLEKYHLHLLTANRQEIQIKELNHLALCS